MRKIVIDPDKKQFWLVWRELLEYRDLFWLLAYRDFKVRYAQTFLGVLWLIIQPVITLAILAVVFGKIANVDTDGVPYVLFAICGVSIWSFASFVISQSGSSIIAAQELIKKVYFPRIINPLAKSVVGSVDLAVGLVFVLILVAYYHVPLTLNLVYLPLFLLLGILASLGIGIWISALSIRYRDFQHLVPFIVQFGLYVSPVGYQSKNIIELNPGWMSFAYFLNPMAGIIDGIRWSILGMEVSWPHCLVSFSCALIIFVSGVYYFSRVEETMADIV